MELRKALYIYYIKVEIKQIEEQLTWTSGINASDKATDYMSAIEYTGMPKSKGYANSAPFEKEIIRNADKMYRLRIRLERKKEELLKLMEEFETFISSIEDLRTRIIIRWRCLENKTWDEIGAELHMDRRTASRIFYKCFQR